MNILLVSDENYAMQLTVLITSILENSSDDFDEHIHIYILNNNIHKGSIEKIKSLEEKYKKAKLHFIDNSEIEKKLENFKDKLPAIDRSTSYYYRLFIISFLPDDIDKILYMDSDIVTNSSLAELYNTNLANYYVAGVVDINETNFKEKINMDPDDVYINSGVMLINLKKWKEDNIQDKIVGFINKTTDKELLYDQHLLNYIFKSNVMILEPRNNVLTHIYVLNYKRFMEIFRMDYEIFTEKEYDKAHTSPVCTHYISSPWRRPWELNSKHPKNDLFFKYKNISPYTNYKIKYNPTTKSYMMKLYINRFIFLNFPTKLVAYMNKHNILNLQQFYN
ncbi:MAG: glycosyltransferase family 8 protein [Methanobrevibacter sp.]|jgi:lipopolysaccharide biosynthesis glycosyltransferase|nr:glycosyltransferase family 8 protein [Candidatus Methanovirga meridionalis]